MSPMVVCGLGRTTEAVNTVAEGTSSEKPVWDGAAVASSQADVNPLLAFGRHMRSLDEVAGRGVVARANAPSILPPAPLRRSE